MKTKYENKIHEYEFYIKSMEEKIKEVDKLYSRLPEMKKLSNLSPDEFYNMSEDINSKDDKYKFLRFRISINIPEQ
jgi:hypothetical protein